MTPAGVKTQALAELVAEYRVVDLSLVLEEGLPAVWPGHMGFAHKVHNWYAASADTAGAPLRSAGPYYTAWNTLDEHAGTHFDAPTHFVPPPGSGLPHSGELGAIDGSKVPLEQLQGPAAVVDLRSLSESGENGVSPRITPEQLLAFEERHGAFRAGEVVIAHTGWDRHYVAGAEGERYMQRPLVQRDSPGWPAPSAEAIVLLHERGVKLFCTDGPSIGAADEGVSMHLAGLGRNLLYVEGLTALEQLPVRGAYFVILPLKLAHSSGGNGRAFAYVPRL